MCCLPRGTCPVLGRDSDTYGSQADKIEKLEKEHGWHEEEFDFILQFMRTILLKRKCCLRSLWHTDLITADGASLIYSAPYLANSLQSLIHSSLGIHSLLKRQSLKHNVIDRDKILVPSNWDSWGKIRIIREGFDMEGVSAAWSIEIQDSPARPGDNRPQSDVPAEADDGSSAVAIFEQTIKDPRRDTTMAPPGSQLNGTKIEVEAQDMQSFLTKQLEVLDELKAADEKDRATKQVPQLEMSPLDDNSRVNEHIGPVQFNMGGIQVDADDMLQKLKVSKQQNHPTYQTNLQQEPPLTQCIRSEKPAEPRERRAYHPPAPAAAATRKRTTKPWRTSSRAWSRNPAGVLGGVRLHSILPSVQGGEGVFSGMYF